MTIHKVSKNVTVMLRQTPFYVIEKIILHGGIIVMTVRHRLMQLLAP